MKFSLAGKVYDASDLDLLSLQDILLFEQQTEDMGRKVPWDEVEEWAEEINALKTDKEKLKHPKALWMTAVVIWASRRAAGELLTFGDAIDFPLRDLSFIREPTDRKKPANPTRARPRTRPGSGRASRPGAAAAAPEPGSQPTSAAESMTG